MANAENEKPPEDKPAEGEPVKLTNDEISDKIAEALKGDENLSDDDRRAIGEGVAGRVGGKAPAPVKPDTDHWTTRKLW